METGGEAELTLAGPCMRPWLLPGDRVTVTSTHGLPLVGSIALFERDGHLYVHRVIDSDGERVLTRGDLSKEDDGWRGEDELLGVAIAVTPGARASWRPRLDLRTPSVRLAMRSVTPLVRGAWRLKRTLRALRG